MSGHESKFDIWWNSPDAKRLLGAAYSLGASIVIIGAMFKILHLPGASLMLGTGMSVEAFLFALGVFDQPHRDYDWDKIYDFDGTGMVTGTGNVNVTNSGSQPVGSVSTRSVGLNYTETINDDDVKKLSEGIKNLTVTAQQFSGLSNVVGATEQFVKNIDGATQVTGKFIKSQESLNGATGLLTTSYQGITDGMDIVEKNTKQYAGKVEEINKNLSSINSIYEIHLKNIQAQSEGLTQQTERVRTVTDELNIILGDVQKMKSATVVAAQETESFKASTTKLAKQVADLNQVYGNMLNALS
ncbi:MAG TPA: gliding motility protein GldL [Paludibacter sp.]